MMIDKLKTLLAKCKCGVHLTVNEHRNYYESAEDRLEWYSCLESPPDIPEDVRAEILKSGNIIDLHFYPDTPVGSYHIIHHDIDQALEIAFECLRSEASTSPHTPEASPGAPP
jgi:hypothetical protein